MLKAKPLSITKLRSGLFSFASSIYSSQEQKTMSMETAHNLETAFVTLTELLTDFELECTGTLHEIRIGRSNIKDAFELVYQYFPKGCDENLSRVMIVTGRDSMRIKTKHDHIITDFRRMVAKNEQR